jgi:hypothetical protein
MLVNFAMHDIRGGESRDPDIPSTSCFDGSLADHISVMHCADIGKPVQGGWPQERKSRSGVYLARGREHVYCAPPGNEPVLLDSHVRNANRKVQSALILAPRSLSNCRKQISLIIPNHQNRLRVRT